MRDPIDEVAVFYRLKTKKEVRVYERIHDNEYANVWRDEYHWVQNHSIGMYQSPVRTSIRVCDIVHYLNDVISSGMAYDRIHFKLLTGVDHEIHKK